METAITKMLGIKYPIIMAPMFLVSNSKMVIEALNSGITGAIPALNYRSESQLKTAIEEIKNATDKPFGINLIVNKSNYKYKSQLKTCVDMGVDYIITSLGNPQEVIDQCKAHNIKVFCDVVDLKFAQKVELQGADAIIAVNADAGGHAGNIPPIELIKLLKENCQIPVISAGGVGNHAQMNQMLMAGAAAVSIGSLFIATHESPVSDEYKNALVQYGAKDIVRSSKLSGSPLTVINTPYVQSIGTDASFLEKLLNKNKTLKKYVKMLIALKGMKAVENAAFKATYKTVWCAGPTIEYIKSIRSVSEITKSLVGEE